jgi:hypothetical protein
MKLPQGSLAYTRRLGGRIGRNRGSIDVDGPDDVIITAMIVVVIIVAIGAIAWR